MWRALLNAWKVKELRNRLLFTALIIVLVRFASWIPCPGVGAISCNFIIIQSLNKGHQLLSASLLTAIPRRA